MGSKSKLTDAEKLAIANAYEAGESAVAIARRFHVTPQSVYWTANARGVRRRLKEPVKETDPLPTHPPRAPLLPWYSEPSIPHQLERLIVHDNTPDPYAGRQWQVSLLFTSGRGGGRA